MSTQYMWGMTVWRAFPLERSTFFTVGLSIKLEKFIEIEKFEKNRQNCKKIEKIEKNKKSRGWV
jgi:hypothetical protein